MSGSFVHCHCHSSYSLLDGLGRIDDLLMSARGAGMPALALTDHGTMFGAIEFYGRAKELGVKPIIGCEVYVTDGRYTDRSPDGKIYHLVLLAENEVGYRNLIRLTTEAHLQGFYRKPRIDHDLLAAHAEGLVCLSACASGELARLILNDDMPGAEQLADWYRSVFPNRYYLELQYHEIDFQKKINQGVVHVSQRLGLPLVATNDVHYVEKRQALTHEILLCIQTQTTLSDPKRMKMESQEFYLKSPEEMMALFSSYPGAITNSLEIAERCSLNLEFGRPQLPTYSAPDGQTSEAYLRALAEEGLARRYPDLPAAARERLEYELSVISSTGFADYILLVYDVIHFARSRGIAVGPGRGSAAGSIVTYCLFLTNVDPLAHGLSFERFLNVERVNMPDMDLDFADDRRDEVIRYVTEKYGRDRVAQIITFGTIGPRAGVRDVGKVIGMSYPDIDKVAKLVPFMCSKMSKAREDVPELQQLYDADPAIQRLMDTVEDLEGVARHASTHAAGVVIARDPLIEHVPLYKVPKNDQITTQYAMASIEKIGLLKMDFLGLRTLTILDRACRFVRDSLGEDVNVENIPLDDPAIYELLSTGETHGVFQVDGAGFRKLLRELRPTNFNQVVACGALYRPGPMEHIPEFIARKNGVKEVVYDHPALAEVLEETYGIVVYQEQVMRLAVLVAGYTMGEADLLRRAMGKKKPEELAKHRATFVDRAAARGTDRGTAERLFDIMEPFAGYAFNKAHAAAYAVITCQTAYLKAHYPRAYLAGLLSAERENADKIAEAMAECSRLGIPILPPNINHSDFDFTLEGEGIRFGLSAVKHVGAAAIEAILEARRDGGTFGSLEEFCSRVDWSVVNKRVIESLAKCGAFDDLGVDRGRVLASLDRIVAFGSRIQREASSAQNSLFGEVGEPEAVLQLAVADSASLEDRLEWEKDLLGIYVTPHPLSRALDDLRKAGVMAASEVGAEQSGARTVAAGMIRGLRSFSTKSGQPMATFQLADLQSALEVIVFTRSYSALQGRLVEGAMVCVEGKCDAQDGGLRLIADAIHTPEEAQNGSAPVRRDNGSSGHAIGASATNGNGKNGHKNGRNATIPEWRVRIEVSRSSDRTADIDRIERLYAVLQRFPGPDPVELTVRTPNRLLRPTLPLPRTSYSDDLRSALTSLLGEGELLSAEPLPHPSTTATSATLESDA